MARAASFGAGRELNLPDEVVVERVPDDGGQEVQRESRRCDLVRDVLSRYDPDPLRYFLTVAGPGDAGHRLHVGRVPATKQRRARGRPGAISSTARCTNALPQLRRGTRRRAVDGRGRGLLGGRAGFDTVGALIEEATFEAAARRSRCGSPASGNQYVDRAGAVGRNRGRARTGRDDPVRGPPRRGFSSRSSARAVLPFSSQKLHELLGYDVGIAGALEFRDDRRGRRRGTRCLRATTRSG